jgi:hypothetical protein
VAILEVGTLMPESQMDQGQVNRLMEATSVLTHQLYSVAPHGLQILHKPGRGGFPSTWSVILKRTQHTYAEGFGETMWGALRAALENLGVKLP